ncbi:SGNH/GDSL hydrolase family protein [Rhodococcus sp. NPDC054953]
MDRTSRRTLAAGAVIAATVSLGASGTASAAPAVEYVNLGDSFSAGSGVAPMVPGTLPTCWQSERNFAHLVAEDRGYRLTDVSCGGAKTDDFYRPQFPGLAPQLDALTPTTDVVTMMIGGNNNDTFGLAMAKCIGAAALRPAASNPCQQQYGDSLAAPVRENTQPALVQALRDVRARAPHAQVVIVGYPRLLPTDGGCAPAMPLAAGDIPYLNDLQDTLNAAVAAAAAETGSVYVDMAQASLGRDGCQPAGQRWVEPMIGATQPVPVHPNATGERALADAVLAAIGTA